MIKTIEYRGYIFQIDTLHPTWRYKGAKAPRVPEPPAILIVGEEPKDLTMMRMKRRSGYQKTILTGDLVPESTGKKTELG